MLISIETILNPDSKHQFRYTVEDTVTDRAVKAVLEIRSGLLKGVVEKEKEEDTNADNG